MCVCVCVCVVLCCVFLVALETHCHSHLSSNTLLLASLRPSAKLHTTATPAGITLQPLYLPTAKMGLFQARKQQLLCMFSLLGGVSKVI